MSYHIVGVKQYARTYFHYLMNYIVELSLSFRGISLATFPEEFFLVALYDIPRRCILWKLHIFYKTSDITKSFDKDIKTALKPEDIFQVQTFSSLEKKGILIYTTWHLENFVDSKLFHICFCTLTSHCIMLISTS